MDAAAAQHKEGAHKNAARQRVLQMLLQDPTVNDSGQSMKGKFRDPAELIGRGR